MVFHDRAQDSTKRLSLEDSHYFLSQFSTTLQSLLDGFLPFPKGVNDTAFTRLSSGGEIELRSDRPALLVSSTSWTIDEDFSILLDALSLYERAAIRPHARLPKVVVLITGKGALKATFENKISKMQQAWIYVRCGTTWLESADYPKLLGRRTSTPNAKKLRLGWSGCADLGISLHSSSSGLDFPMKIVDMFGSGLPVLALDFAW